MDKIDKRLLSKLKDKLYDNDLQDIADILYEYDPTIVSNFYCFPNDEDFFENNFSDKMEVARAVSYGDYNYADEYVRLNGYGNLQSREEYEYMEDLNDNADEMLDNAYDLYQANKIELPERVTEIIDDYEEEKENAVTFKDAYEDYQKQYNDAFHKTGVFWAFGHEQFDENKTHKDAPDNEYIAVGAGGYIHKDDKLKLDNFYRVTAPALKKDFVSKIDMDDLIKYELNNHECYYTGEYDEVVPIVQDFFEDKSKEEIESRVDKVYNDTLEKNDDLEL